MQDVEKWIAKVDELRGVATPYLIIEHAPFRGFWMYWGPRD